MSILKYNKEFVRWTKFVKNEKLILELNAMGEDAVEDAFYRNLSFGTGGLRGVIGVGTNRMNIYTVAKATQGLANFLLKKYKNPSVAISFDSRIKSDLFSLVAAVVFASNGLRVWIYKELMPTPCLSYAVRALKCSSGVMVTASHNPAKYNGYKVYGSDGCQITTKVAQDIFEEIEKIDVFSGVNGLGYFETLDSADQLKEKLFSIVDDFCGNIEYIPTFVYDDFIAEVTKQSVLFGDKIDCDVTIVYSPLNGTGLKPVTRVLEENGYSNVIIVDEQKNPDGNFPTCPFPNPEIDEAMKLGIEYCEKNGADILIATDPDADRCGIAVKEKDASYRLLSGNEVGLLILDFVCAQRIKHDKMPKHPVFVKTIVTTDLAEKIASHYGVRTVNVLTGFKFIGEVIGRMQAEGNESDYICGFEESYGYLTGTYVRDKDAINATFMICEMFAYYKTRGISLIEKLNWIYAEYGYSLNTLHSYEFEGAEGMKRMTEIMSLVRVGITYLGDEPVEKITDYLNGIDGLPKSDVVKIKSKSYSVIVRPSGTEPKLKVYVSIVTQDYERARIMAGNIIKNIEKSVLNAHMNNL